MVGAIVVTRKVWDGMSPAGRQALLQAGEFAGAELRAVSRREHEESVVAMKKRGLKVQPVTHELEAEWRRIAEQTYPMVRGNLVPAELFDEVQRTLQQFRDAKGERR
jgi:TRAP-type C4-dicarboxylate transport system substrate-binding protein